MLIYSPGADSEVFKQYWLDKFAINENDKQRSTGVNEFNSLYTFDEASLLHKEVTFIHNSNGSYLVAYLGMDGSYQTNRQHLANFLQNLNF